MSYKWQQTSMRGTSTKVQESRRGTDSRSSFPEHFKENPVLVPMPVPVSLPTSLLAPAALPVIDPDTVTVNAMQCTLHCWIWKQCRRRGINWYNSVLNWPRKSACSQSLTTVTAPQFNLVFDSDVNEMDTSNTLPKVPASLGAPGHPVGVPAEASTLCLVLKCTLACLKRGKGTLGIYQLNTCSISVTIGYLYMLL